MKLPSIVCPPEESLLRSFSERTVVVRVNHPGQASKAAAQVQDSGNQLFGIIIDAAASLDRLELGDELQGLPMTVIAPSWGKFRHLAGRLKQWRKLDLCVYLPADNADNLTGLRILSSVGIHSGAVLGDGPKDWEALADLMTYAVLERTPHAAIEPFAFFAADDDPFSACDWGGLYFDDPRQFLHLDGQGRVALSPEDLRQNRFISRSLAEIDSAEASRAIRERLLVWRWFFADNHPCASCKGWKICRGRFARELSQDGGCAAFFEEMVEVVRQHRELRRKLNRGVIWPR